MGNDTNCIPFIFTISFFFWLICLLIGIEVNENRARDAICQQTCITTDCYFACKEQKLADVINELRCINEGNKNE